MTIRISWKNAVKKIQSLERKQPKQPTITLASPAVVRSYYQGLFNMAYKTAK